MVYGQNNCTNPYGYGNFQRPVYYTQPTAFPQAVPQVSAPDPQGGTFNAPSQSGFRVIPVASYDEAKAIPTDFAGDTLILLDLSHGTIYTKALDVSNGTSIFKAFRVQEAVSNDSAEKFDAKSEVEKIKKEIEQLRKEIGTTEKKGRA